MVHLVISTGLVHFLPIPEVGKIPFERECVLAYFHERERERESSSCNTVGKFRVSDWLIE
jgi:hypothetical protein